MKNSIATIVLPTLLAVAGLTAIGAWVSIPLEPEKLAPRLPGMDDVPESARAVKATRPVLGEPIAGEGKPSSYPGNWPWFRGENLQALVTGGTPLARSWPEKGPRRLWEIPMGEGYAAAAVRDGKVYVLDHEHDTAMDLLRGLNDTQRASLADALAEAKPDEADAVVQRLFGPKDGAAAALVAEDRQSLAKLLQGVVAEKRDALLTALRKNAFDPIDRSADVMRCLSLDDGREIWRNSYRVFVAANHGISRTVPAVIGNYVISFGPKCHVVGWDAQTGKALWLLDLVLDYGATVPPWYAGQCPLVDAKTDQLVLAPGGKALVMAVDYRTGKVKWESPNPRGWEMTHVSIVPMEIGGRRTYVYCGKGGVAGIDANSGEILWDTPDWQISMATCPSPVIVDGNRIFLSGGYNSGALMLKIHENGGKFTAETLYRLPPKRFGSEQQTPVYFEGRLYGVRQKDQQLVCLDLDGNELWNSGRDKFGSAPYMIADGLIFAMNDKGLLTVAEATPKGYKRLMKAQVIEDATDSWGPMALVGGRLIVRDMTRMVCLDVSDPSASGKQDAGKGASDGK